MEEATDNPPPRHRIRLGDSLPEDPSLLQEPRLSRLLTIPPPPVVALIRRSVEMLAENCDGAHAQDEMGFNKNDTERGHRLVAKGDWTMGDLEWAMNKIILYHRQVPSEVLKRVKEYL